MWYLAESLWWAEFLAHYLLFYFVSAFVARVIQKWKWHIFSFSIWLIKLVFFSVGSLSSYFVMHLRTYAPVNNVTPHSRLLPDKWLDHDQTFTWWSPGDPAFRMRSRSRSKVTWYGLFFDFTKIASSRRQMAGMQHTAVPTLLCIKGVLAFMVKCHVVPAHLEFHKNRFFSQAWLHPDQTWFFPNLPFPLSVRFSFVSQFPNGCEFVLWVLP